MFGIAIYFNNNPIQWSRTEKNLLWFVLSLLARYKIQCYRYIFLRIDNILL